MEFNELMQELGKTLEIPEFKPTPSGDYQLGVDAMELTFIHHPESNQVVTIASVCELPDCNREPIYEVLLQGMFLGKATNGACFSIDDDKRLVYLHRYDLLNELDVNTFSEKIEWFVEVLEKWRDVLIDYVDMNKNPSQEADVKSGESTVGEEGWNIRI